MEILNNGKKAPKHKKNSTLLIETKYGVLNHLQFKILFFIHTNNQFLFHLPMMQVC